MIATLFCLAAANEFREVLNQDLQPQWVKVWTHLYLGKIFDATGQRDRALNPLIRVYPRPSQPNCPHPDPE